MIYRAYMTCDIVTSESAADGMPAESGWVDPTYSMSTVHDSRNDVSPASTYDPSDSDDVELYPTVADWVAATVSELLGAADDNGDGTFYAADSVTLDYATDETYSYALHFHAKDYGRDGWREFDVPADGFYYAGAGVEVSHVNGVEVTRTV